MKTRKAVRSQVDTAGIYMDVYDILNLDLSPNEFKGVASYQLSRLLDSLAKKFKGDTGVPIGKYINNNYGG